MEPIIPRNDSSAPNGRRTTLLTALAIILIPVALRLAVSIAIPVEADADGYTHALCVDDTAKLLRAGDMRPGNLQGFWLPLYHLVCAALSLVFGHVYWTCRVVSALAGAASCALVWMIAFRVFRSRVAAWAAWLLLLTAPWHVLYSAFAMTEVSFGLCVAASVYFLVRSNKENRFFIPAALAVCAACLLRYEGWVLAPVIWLVAAGQRRTRFWTLMAGGVLMAMPVAGWHVLNHMVTGDAFWHIAFQKTNLAEYYALYPALAPRGAWHIARHVGLLGFVGGPAVFVLGFSGLVIILRDGTLRRVSLPVWLIVAAQVSFTIYSYLAGDAGSFARYWVPAVWGMAVLGGLAVARLGELLWRDGAAMRKTAATAGIALAACLNIGIFAGSAHWIVGQAEAILQVSAELRRLHGGSPRCGRVYTDEPAVMFQSGLPRESFTEPFVMPRDRGKALEFLKSRNVEYVVWLDAEYAAARYAFPELAGGGRSPQFTLCVNPSGNEERRRRGSPEILLFRVTSK